jgi:probable F420-dependent oxidoreductase
MKFGLVLPNFGPQASRFALIDTAIAAENTGFDSIWLTDHLALPKTDSEMFGHIYESLTSMSFLAASTRNIKIGTSTLVLPQRNPIEVAKSIATIDNLSGGRIIVSVGIGWSKGEYQNLGYDFKNRGKRMNEAIKILRTCWRGQSIVSFKGDYFQFENMSFSPTPVQSGGPPLWVAGDSQKALKRAIGLADGWHPNAHSPQVLEDRLSTVKSIIQLRPFTIAVRLNILFSSQSENEGSSIVSGNHDDIISKLKEYQKAGMNYAILNFRVKSQSERERSMKLFMKEIAPAFIQTP